jgi:hypothetical protein
MSPGWYLSRLRRMSPAELAQRGATAARQWWWSAEARRPDLLAALLPGERTVSLRLPRAAAPTGTARDAVFHAAERLLQGEWRLFHLALNGLGAAPDWFADPLTGRRAPQDAYCFRIPHRDESAVGNIKFVWELSRHQPSTLLACAWWLTGDDRFAERACLHLASWWDANPFLQGVQWVSAIEAGLRLLSWTWIRFLLADWPGAAAAFEHNDAFLAQLYGHCRFIAAFPSTGSSANNHLIAELAGLHAASLAFPLFKESGTWARRSGEALAREAAAQTHADGWNREQASAYHMFVAEMLLAACLPARQLGRPLPGVEAVLRRMIDALAASLDETGRPPRFGDSDDARGLLVDAPDTDPAMALLDVGRALWGAPAWWPAESGSVLGSIAARSRSAEPDKRPVDRPSLFPDAGIAILRAGPTWLRCDGGPHGYRSIAAHGHADALSIELRIGGVEVLADPGTYCYHGEPAWRALFRGTRGHNTLAVRDKDQARAAGPFLWLDHPRTVLEEWQPGRAWQARHGGYGVVIHHRRVELVTEGVIVTDWLRAPDAAPATLYFHFGPDVQVQLVSTWALLQWPGGASCIALPPSLHWTLHRGEQDPPLGWYSRGFGHRTPAFTLAGRGTVSPGERLQTRLKLPQEGSTA